MVDRETLYRTFYGEKPPPKPWATDCPIRFDVWLAFARMVRNGAVPEVAGAPVAGPGPAQPASDPLPAGVPANLEGHPRVDVILSVSDEFGPARLLERLRGEGPVPRAGPPFANLIAAGSYVAANGSAHNSDPLLYQRVTTDHHVISADGIAHAHPDLATLDWIVDARGADGYEIHLTNPIPPAVEHLRNRAAGRNFSVESRTDPASGIVVSFATGA